MADSGFAGFWKTYSIPGQRASAEARLQKEHEAKEKDRARDEEWRTGRQAAISKATSEDIFSYEDGGVPVKVGSRPRDLDTAGLMNLVEEVSAHDFKYGKMPLLDFASAKQKVKALQNEGFFDAYAKFKTTGDARAAGEEFNKTGKVKLDLDSLKAEEVTHPSFGVKYKIIRGKTADGQDFTYDPIQAAAIAGGAKGYETHLKNESDAVHKRAEETRKDKETNAKVDMYKAHARLYDAGATDKTAKAGGKFEFKPVDQARISTQVAARMQKIDTVSNKEVDHDATPEAIGLAGEIYKESKGEIGIDQAVALVARKDAWMTNEEAEKQARADLKKMERKGLLGGGDVVLSKGKGGDKTVSADAYVKTRKQELLDKNRQEIRERARKMAGIGGRAPAAAGGLPRNAGGVSPKISPAARSVLEEALGE